MQVEQFSEAVVQVSLMSCSSDVDGFNMWDTLKKGDASPRKEVLLNIDSEAFYHRGLVSGDWKLIRDGK